jgi:pimeloyl-ACP methyl ester carboxylesterase
MTNKMLTVKRRSHFKNPIEDKRWFMDWVGRLETLNNKTYHPITIDTALGRTQVYRLGPHQQQQETLVIFPGARTSALFWDFENGLELLSGKVRIYLVETNGLPNLSDGDTPDIKSLDYGHWAAEVLDKLNLSETYIAGASFGGLICAKLCIVAPSRVKSAFLLNAGCLQPFSISAKNLYYNILPIAFPTRKTVSLFLNNAVLYPPSHTLSPAYYSLLVEYELFVLKRYVDNTQKPYDMNHELTEITVDIYLIQGTKDLLFPMKTSVSNAKQKIKSLKKVIAFEDVGHGIETYPRALDTIEQLIFRGDSRK